MLGEYKLGNKDLSRERLSNPLDILEKFKEQTAMCRKSKPVTVVVSAYGETNLPNKRPKREGQFG